MVATTVYLLTSATVNTSTLGTNTTNKAGSGIFWQTYNTSTTQGVSHVLVSTATADGPTSGIELAISSVPIEWISPPLAADVTISGTVTFNVWAYESNMQANATVACMAQRVAATTFALSDIVTGSSFGTELGTSAAAKQWTSASTSTNMLKGDRFRIVLYFDDATALTMATGYSGNVRYGYDVTLQADTWVQFAEDITFQVSDPSTQTLRLTETASDVATADIDYKTFTATT